MSEPIYNAIGVNYNQTRKADPYIASRIYALLSPAADGHFLDVGCGTGNYLQALNGLGLHFTGIDPSEKMLAEARMRCPETEFIQGKAEHLPFDDGAFDGAIVLFTTHHWDDLEKGLSQLSRVLKPGANAVFLSFTPQQMKGYWLNEYFPKMMKRSWELVPEKEEMEHIILKSGFKNIISENYFIHEGLEDKFLYANKYKPGQYLLPEVRNGASSFAAFSDPAEVEAGLKSLADDIDSGHINEIIRKYDNTDGDYIFWAATK